MLPDLASTKESRTTYPYSDDIASANAEVQAFAQLLVRARRNDAAAITALYQQALPPLYRYVLVRIRQPELVEDVLGEIFLEMVEALPNLRAAHKAGFFAWIFSIAHARVVTTQRRLAREHAHRAPSDPTTQATFFDLPDPTSYDPAAIQERHEDLAALGAALELLTEEQQFVIIGRFFADQSIEEIAQALHKQPGAVRALQFRALERLASRLGQRRLKGGRHDH